MSIKGIPSNETILLERKSNNGEIYFITSNNSRDCYYIYKYESGKAIKLGKGHSTLLLEEKYVK